jgi:tetratricopeptide (TPR) repeat protein
MRERIPFSRSWCGTVKIAPVNSESTFNDALSEVQDAITAADYDRAIALTDDLLVSYPDALSVWRMRASAFSASGRPFQAAEAYARVLDIVPVDVDAMSNMAMALSASGQHAEAKLAARQALDYEPENAALLRIVALPGVEEANFPDVGAHLREGLGDVRAGLLDRGIARLSYAAAQRPDRVDVQVALAHALWQAGARVAAAEVCQSILDAQPDCLNAHALLLALWKSIGPSGLELPHLNAIARLDPDHRHVKALLGDASPLDVQDVPAVRPPGFQPPDEEAADRADWRADWVDDLVAAASSAPRPLERHAPPFAAPDASHPLEGDDILIAAASQDAVEEEVGGDVVHLDDVQATPAESLIPLEWEESEELLEAPPVEEGASPVWLSEDSGAEPEGFAPARPQRPMPDAADGVPAYIEPLEWEAEERLAGQPAETVEPKPPTAKSASLRPVVGAAAGLTTAAARAAAAREAVSQSRWQEAVTLYEKAIVASRGKALDAVIADLEAVRAAQPSARAVHELLGMAYARKGDVAAALDAYHRAMALAADI